MHKRIITVLVAGTLTLSVVPVAHADEPDLGTNQEVTENQSAQSSSEDTSSTDASSTDDGVQGGSSVETFVAVAVIAGVAAAIGGGVHWAVQQRIIPNLLPGIIPTPPAPKKPQVQTAVAKPAPAPAPKTNPAPVHRPAPAVGYQNCVDVWNKLGRSIYPRDAGFQSKFDRDGDGVGCERDPR